MAMPLPDIDSLLKLDLETRLAVVQMLWDSIFQDAPEGAALPVSPQDRELFDARLKEDDDDPDAAIPRGRSARCAARRAVIRAGRA